MPARIEGEPINLRGHHLSKGSLLVLSDSYRREIERSYLDSAKAAGYGETFIDQSIEFWAQLGNLPDLEIRLVDALDCFCLNFGCPRRRPDCSSQEAEKEDDMWIKSLGLELNGIYTVRQICDAIKSKIESLTPGLKL